MYAVYAEDLSFYVTGQILLQTSTEVTGDLLISV